MSFDVTTVQQRLADAGYYHEQIDGAFGRRSYCALFACVARRDLADRGLAIGEGCVANFASAGLTSGLRMAHFIAQTATETSGFRTLSEDLNYTAKGLKKVWPKRFKSDADTLGYVMNPVALANKVYADRLGNGPPSSGDGYHYRGRGLIQLTGRSNYAAREAETSIALVAMPELASDPKTSVRIACLYWASRNINALADADKVEKVRRAVNGGTHGLPDTKIFLKRAKAILL